MSDSTSTPKNPKRIPPSGVPETDIRTAHGWSSKHRDDLLRSERCGCFYCVKVFSPTEITEWITEPTGGQTALCPHCGIDSVIGSHSGYPIEVSFLDAMKARWFG